MVPGEYRQDFCGALRPKSPSRLSIGQPFALGPERGEARSIGPVGQAGSVETGRTGPALGVSADGLGLWPSAEEVAGGEPGMGLSRRLVFQEFELFVRTLYRSALLAHVRCLHGTRVCCSIYHPQFVLLHGWPSLEFRKWRSSQRPVQRFRRRTPHIQESYTLQ